MYGSEDCELTEQLWARTERQKLREFSEKQLMTAATTTTNPTTTTNTTTSTTPTSCITSNEAANRHPSALPPRPRPSKGAAAMTTCEEEEEVQKGNYYRWAKNSSSKRATQPENGGVLSDCNHLIGPSFAKSDGGSKFRENRPQHLSGTASTARNSSSSSSSSSLADGDDDNNSSDICSIFGDVQGNKRHEEFNRRCGRTVADDDYDDGDDDDDAGRKVPEGKIKGPCRGDKPAPPPRDPEITHPDRGTEYPAAERRREVHF